LLLAASLLAGCASYRPVPVGREEIVDAVAPGDTVRMRLAGEPDELTVRVSSLGADALRGRVRGAPDDQLTGFCFDRIEHIEVARPDLRKALLTTVLPVLIAAAILCQNHDCRTHSSIVGAR
jgi:hypothetical protein